MIEGKTKTIRPGATPGEVILETKDDLTGGDAAKLETIEGIAVHKTTQTRNVFRLLESRGIATAFIRPHDERSIVCHQCRMLPLELVIRRYAWGSFLKREPELVSTHESPHRFDELLCGLRAQHLVSMKVQVLFADLSTHFRSKLDRTPGLPDRSQRPSSVTRLLSIGQDSECLLVEELKLIEHVSAVLKVADLSCIQRLRHQRGEVIAPVTEHRRRADAELVRDRAVASSCQELLVDGFALWVDTNRARTGQIGVSKVRLEVLKIGREAVERCS